MFIEFTKAPEIKVENAFLVHIDKKIMERTLKAIRRNDTQKNPKELYQLKICISYNNKHKLEEPSGWAFRKNVLKDVYNGDVIRYQKMKSQIIIMNSLHIDGSTLTTPDEMFEKKDLLETLSCVIQNDVEKFKVKFIDEICENSGKVPYTFVMEIGRLAIGAITLLHLERIKDKDFQVIKSEVVKPIVFQSGMPSRAELEKLEVQTLKNLLS